MPKSAAAEAENSPLYATDADAAMLPPSAAEAAALTVRPSATAYSGVATYADQSTVFATPARPRPTV